MQIRDLRSASKVQNLHIAAVEYSFLVTSKQNMLLIVYHASIQALVSFGSPLYKSFAATL